MPRLPYAAEEQLWFTDPPYYDAVPYADLSDFFFVWLKRTASESPFAPDPFESANLLHRRYRNCVDGTGRIDAVAIAKTAKHFRRRRWRLQWERAGVC